MQFSKNYVYFVRLYFILFYIECDKETKLLKLRIEWSSFVFSMVLLYYVLLNNLLDIFVEKN